MKSLLKNGQGFVWLAQGLILNNFQQLQNLLLQKLLMPCCLPKVSYNVSVNSSKKSRTMAPGFCVQ
jgi:hypothetical protein